VTSLVDELVQGTDLEVERTQHSLSALTLAAAGDGVIFAGSVGRTDLPGASWEQLAKSIKTQVFTLPDETRLLSGHGPETTVGEEKMNNPFVGDL